MKRGAIFDMDGTVADSMWVWQEVDRVWMQMHNIPPSEELNHVLKTSPFPVSAQYVIEHYDLKQTQEDVMRQWRDLAADAYEHAVLLKEGVLDFLQYLKENDVAMTLATSCLKDPCFRLLRKYELGRYFDQVLFTQDFHTDKRKPDLYLACAEAMGLMPEECVVFEDIRPALEGASLAGMKTVAVYDAVASEPWAETVHAATASIRYWQEAKDVWESL